MAPRHVATIGRPQPAGGNIVRSTLRIGLASAALALGVCASIAHADNTEDKPRQPDANVQRTAHGLPPARVILPAPWEPATPAGSAAAPAAPPHHQ